MGFNLGAGLAAMGGSIATTAGEAAINAQKADLDTQRELLADRLATTRETGLETMREGAAEKLQKGGIAGQIEVVGATAKANLATHIAEAAADTTEAVNKLKVMSTPDAIRAQHAIAMASAVPNLSVQVKDDGSAVTFNPESGKVTPLMDASGQPIRFQNPAIAQAVVQQTNTLKDASNNLDRNYKSELDAARVLHKDDSPEDQQKAIDAVNKYYRPKIENINSQLMSLTAALGTKTGVNGASIIKYDAKGNPIGGPASAGLSLGSSSSDMGAAGGFPGMNGAAP